MNSVVSLENLLQQESFLSISIGSIEYTSLKSAFDFIEKGNIDVARSIISHINLSSEQREVILDFLSSFKKEPEFLVEATPTPTNAPPLPPKPQPLATEIFDASEDSELLNSYQDIFPEASSEQTAQNIQKTRDVFESITISDEIESIDEARDEVFKYDPLEQSIPIPPVIKTYDTTFDTLENERVSKQKKEVILSKAQKMFSLFEKYLKKAKELEDPSVFASAKRQLENLIERYPQYVETFPERIKLYEHDLSLIQDVSENTDTTLTEIILGGSKLTIGKKITSTRHTYILTQIMQEGPQVYIWFSDESNSIYKVKAFELERAMTDETVDTEEFMEKFLLRSSS